MWVRVTVTMTWTLPIAWLASYLAYSLAQHLAAPHAAGGYPAGLGTLAVGAAISAAVSVIAVRKRRRR